MQARRRRARRLDGDLEVGEEKVDSRENVTHPLAHTSRGRRWAVTVPKGRGELLLDHVSEFVRQRVKAEQVDRVRELVRDKLGDERLDVAGVEALEAGEKGEALEVPLEPLGEPLPCREHAVIAVLASRLERVGAAQRDHARAEEDGES